MKKRVLTVGVVLALAIGLAGIAAAGLDFGKYRDKTLANLSKDQFGFGGPLANSSSQQVTRQQAQADPSSLFTLANGLTRTGGIHRRRPGHRPELLLAGHAITPSICIACNEQSTSGPGLQRIDIATGAATTIVTGTRFCDPVRQTPWGTYIFGEEAGTAGAAAASTS